MSCVNVDKLGSKCVKSAVSGEQVELSSLWRDQTVVMFFLRRFGCQICRWAAVEVSKLEKDLRVNRVALVGIGPEETGLKEFQDGGFFKGEIYIDENKQCYKDLGFKSRSKTYKSCHVAASELRLNLRVRCDGAESDVW
ncbi:prostamide/prostaglandin F synthase [Tachysurus ichikawai]